jgi:hypothetical protein
MNKMEWEKTIERATENALFEFWASIAKQFPDVEGGEFDIGMSFEMSAEMERFVAHWLDYNHSTYRKDHE